MMCRISTKIAFVVATKDRPHDLKIMLQSLSDQTRRPDQVVIVDASRIPVKSITKAFRTLKIRYLRHSKPSAAAQRNFGISAVDPDIDLVGFLDDDAILEKQALSSMMAYWGEDSSGNLGGCAFNLMNPPPTSGKKLKTTAFAKLLGLYSDQKGVVMSSGWQTLAGTVSRTIFVEWLSSCASIWRRDLFNKYSFDEFFDRYSYLEDLDFSYSVGRKYQLAIVSDAEFYHYPSLSGKGGGYQFGKSEVRNRLYFVKKHNLSLLRCYFGIGLRTIMTLGVAIRGREKFHVERLFGNCSGLVRSVFSI